MAIPHVTGDLQPGALYPATHQIQKHIFLTVIFLSKSLIIEPKAAGLGLCFVDSLVANQCHCAELDVGFVQWAAGKYKGVVKYLPCISLYELFAQKHVQYPVTFGHASISLAFTFSLNLCRRTADRLDAVSMDFINF